MAESPILLAVQSRDEATQILEHIGSALSKLGLRFRAMGKDAQGATQSTSDIGKANPYLLGVGLAGIAAAAGVALIAKSSVDAAAEFQSATADMVASGNLTEKVATAIGDAFLSTAGKTVFSAKQQMDAIAPLAGELQLVTGHTLTTADATKVMTAAMNLAEAANIGLDSATRDVVNVMKVYHLTTGQAAQASDILYETARLTGQSLDSVTSSVDRLKGRLGPLGPSLSDVSTLIVDLNKHGVEGRMAMMAATQGMNTLLSGSKNSAAEIRKLNLVVFDSHGKFVGMRDVISQLAPKLAGMTQQQRLMAERMLFGATAGRELDAVILDGAKGYDRISTMLNQHNAAQRAAEERAKTYQNQQRALNATVDDMKVMLGTQLIPVLQQLLGFVTPIITSLAQWMNQHRQLSAAILIGVGVVGMLTAAVAVLSLVMSLNPISLVIIAIAALVAGIVYAYTHVKWFRDAVNAVWGFLKMFFGPAVQDLGIGFRVLAQLIAAAWLGIQDGWNLLKKFGSWLGSTFGPVVKKIGDALGAIGGGISGVAGLAKELHVPGFQHGGIVTGTKPVLSVLHPPEAIIPLSGGRPLTGSSTPSLGGGGGDTSALEDLLEQILAVLQTPVDTSGSDAALYALIKKVMRGRQRALAGS